MIEYNVLLSGSTKLTGNWASEEANIALSLGNNIFIVANSGKFLKMVKIKVQGEFCFGWMAAKQHRDKENYPESCKDPSTFTEACFEGPGVSKDNYNVQLVADRKSTKRRKRQSGSTLAKSF